VAHHGWNLAAKPVTSLGTDMECPSSCFSWPDPSSPPPPPLLGRVSPTALVIVLEDLRWADRDTVELVEYLAGIVSGLLVLLVLTLRDTPASTASAAGARGSWRAITYLPLERLTDGHLTTLVRACRAPRDSGLCRRVKLLQ